MKGVMRIASIVGIGLAGISAVIAIAANAQMTVVRRAMH
jgi:hypothetical protein